MTDRTDRPIASPRRRFWRVSREAANVTINTRTWPPDTPLRGGGFRAPVQASAAMRAASIRDGSIVVEEHPEPRPEAGELLVRVRAAGLNGADMLQLAGRYPPPRGAPEIPGLELAGEVIECGRGVARCEPGDRVMAVVAGGGQAELAVVHESAAMPVPDELEWVPAGGVPEFF